MAKVRFNNEIVTLGNYGDILTNDGTADYVFPLGTDTQILQVNATSDAGLEWIDFPNTSVLTTKGDLSTYDTDDVRLPVGTDGQILVANSATATGLEWQAASAGSSPLTTKGDIYTYDTSDQRLAVGTDGQFLAANSATATGLEWQNAPSGGGTTDFTELYLQFNETAGATTFIDSSQRVNTVTTNGSPIIVASPSQEGNALSINSPTQINNWISVPETFTMPGSSDFTLEFFIYWNAPISAVNFAPVIFSNRNGGSTGWSLSYLNGNLQYTSDADAQNFPFTPSASTWYHIALCSDSGTVRCFIDGTQVGTNFVPSTPPATAGGNTLYFGSDNANSQNHNTVWDELRIVVGRALYTSNFTVPSVPLGSYTESTPILAANVDVAATPTNYTASAQNVEEHLIGIDNALGIYTGAKMRLDVPQTISDNLETVVTFDNEVYDDDSYIDIGGNPTRVTFQQAGTYQFDIFSVWASNASGFRQTKLRINGVTDLGGDREVPLSGTLSLYHSTVQRRLSASDYVEVVVYQNSGGNLDYSFASTELESYIAVTRIA